MAFSTWEELRTAIKDAIATSVAGSPCTGEYEIKGRRLVYRSYDELVKLFKTTFDMEALESASMDSSVRVSYGRPRSFRA